MTKEQFDALMEAVEATAAYEALATHPEWGSARTLRQQADEAKRRARELLCPAPAAP